MQEQLVILPESLDWDIFDKRKELLDFLWKNLKLKEKNEGDWQYMNFYTGMSTWELSLDDGSCGASVCVITSEEDDEQITDFTIALKDSSIYNLQLIKELIHKLKKDFKLELSQKRNK